jgi:hypothetical protein
MQEHEPKMIALTLSIPVAVNEAMKKLAERNRRSAQKQYIWELENIPSIKELLESMQEIAQEGAQ